MSSHPLARPHHGRTGIGRVVSVAALVAAGTPAVGSAQSVSHHVVARLGTTVGPLVRSTVSQVTRDSAWGVAVVRVEANTAWVIRADAPAGLGVEVRVGDGPWHPLPEAHAALPGGVRGSATVTVEWRAATPVAGMPPVELAAVPVPTAQ